MSIPTESSEEPDDRPRTVRARPRTYLVAKNDAIAPLGSGPLDFEWIVEQLQAAPEVDVVARLEPRNVMAQKTGPSTVSTVLVASMPDDMAAQLVEHPQLVLEEDLPLFPVPAPVPGAGPVERGSDPSVFLPFGATTEWQVRLTASDGAPVSGATVYLYGSGIPAQGRTDDDGLVTLSLLNESDATLRALYVNPQREHWSLWIDDPSLVAGTVNTVTLQSLSDTIPGFPEEQHVGWGQVAMRLDELPSHLDGGGVRVAVVDSGAAARTHPDLVSARHGIDLTQVPPRSTGWTDDTIAHGSHCGGIISGADDGSGIRGFAPAAEVHHARIFPGGRVSSLLDAVDYCMDQQIDVVNMSLGSGGTSQIMLQKLAQARSLGVACIVAAGNSGGPVQFPGSSPDVLTVAAIGKRDQFPVSSYHARQVLTEAGTTEDGYFAAKFSCHGDEVDVCGPGVAVVSSVPQDGYAAWDGTSMAAPHIAGLAALVLAHHPDFQSPAMRLPTAARVERLFDILRSSATPLSLGDRTRTGAGLPDTLKALALDGPPSGPPGESGAELKEPAAAVDALVAALSQVRLELIAVGLLEESAPAVEPAGTVPASGTALASATAPDPRTEISDVDLRRELAGLVAQCAVAGLVVPS